MNCEWVKPRYPYVEGVSLGIDKVSISIPYKPPKKSQDVLTSEEIKVLAAMQAEYKKDFLSHINYVRGMLTNFKATTSHPVKYGSKLDYVQVLCPTDGSHVLTVLLGLEFGTPVLIFSFNPSKLHMEGVWELFDVLQMALPSHYEWLYTNGVISRFEFFVDVAEVKPCDLALLDMGKRVTTRFEGTTYQGRRYSPLAVTMYDKAAQKKSSQKLTRIEARLHRRDITFRQLVESGIDNPFSPFLLVPASALTAVTNKYKNFPQLENEIKQHGLFGGVKNSPARKAIIARLQPLVAPWWSPEAIWELFRKILLGFRPYFIGGITEAAYC